MAVSVSMRSLAPAPPAVSLRPAPAASTASPNSQPRSQPAIRPLAVAPSPAPIQPNFASSSSSSSASSSSSSAVSSASISPPPPPTKEQQQYERRQTLTKASMAQEPSPRAVRSASISSSSSALFPSTGTPAKFNEEDMISTAPSENNGGGSSSSNNNKAKIQPSKSWVLPARAKPGRKPSEEEPPTKRKAQNRASQRAFRERKQSYLASLEEKVAEHERRQTEGSVELQKVAKRFKEENEALQKQMEAMRRAHEEATLRWEEERKRYRMQQRDLEARLAMALQGPSQSQPHHQQQPPPPQQQQQQQRRGSTSGSGYGSREVNATGNESNQARERVPSSGQCGGSSRRTTEAAANKTSVAEKGASSRRGSFVPASPTKDLGLGVPEPFRIDRDCGFCTDQSPCLCSGEAVLDFAGDDNDFNTASDGAQTNPSSHVSVKLEQDNDDFDKQQQKQPPTPTSTKPLGESIFAMRRRSSVTNSSTHVSNANSTAPSQKLWYTIPAQPQSHLSRKEAVQVCPTFTMTDRTPWQSAQQQARSSQMTPASASAPGITPLGLRVPQPQQSHQQHQLTRSGKPKIWSTVPLASSNNAPASSLPSPVFRLGQRPAKTTNDGQVGTHRPRSDSISSVASEAACTGNPADCDACRTDPVLAAFCEAVSSHLRDNEEEGEDDEDEGDVVENGRGKRFRIDGEEEPQRTKRTKWTGPAILEVGNAVPLPLKSRSSTALPLASSSSQSYATPSTHPRGCLRPSATETTRSTSGKLWHFTPANDASTIDQTHAARPVLPHASLSAPTVAGSASYYSNTYQLHQHQHQQLTQQDVNGMRRTSSSSSSPSVALPPRTRHSQAEGPGSSSVQELHRRHGASLSIPRAFQQIRSHPSFQQWWYRQQRLASADAPHPTALLPHGSQPSPPPPSSSSSHQQQQMMSLSGRAPPHHLQHQRHHKPHLHDASPGGLELLADVVSRRSPRLRSRELHGSRSVSRSAIRSAAHSPVRSEARDGNEHGDNGRQERVLVPIETLEAAAARSNGQSSSAATASPRGDSEERQGRKREREEGQGGEVAKDQAEYEGEERRRTRRKLLFVESRAVEDALAMLDSQQDREEGEEEEQERLDEGKLDRVKGKSCYCAGEGEEEKARSSSP